MLLETLMELQCWRWTWSPLKRNPGGSQVCVYLKLTSTKFGVHCTCVRPPLSTLCFCCVFVCLCAGADLSDYFNYGFNEDTWKAYCEKQKRLRMGLEVSTIGSVTSKITVRDSASLFVLVFLQLLHFWGWRVRDHNFDPQ